MVGWQEGRLARKNLIPLIATDSLLEQMEKEDLRGNQVAIKWK